MKQDNFLLINYHSFIIAFKSLITLYGIYLIWILAHYVSSHLYVYFCVPLSFQGFLLSPILITNQYCSSLRWIIFNSGTYINNMWISLGTYFSNKLFN